MSNCPDQIPEDWEAQISQVEPNAAQLFVATEIRGMFTAFIRQGFTEAQAAAILGEYLAQMMRNLEETS